jgi:hypothetical protein
VLLFTGRARPSDLYRPPGLSNEGTCPGQSSSEESDLPRAEWPAQRGPREPIAADSRCRLDRGAGELDQRLTSESAVSIGARTCRAGWSAGRFEAKPW